MFSEACLPLTQPYNLSASPSPPLLLFLLHSQEHKTPSTQVPVSADSVRHNDGATQGVEGGKNTLSTVLQFVLKNLFTLKHI